MGAEVHEIPMEVSASLSTPSSYFDKEVEISFVCGSRGGACGKEARGRESVFPSEVLVGCLLPCHPTTTMISLVSSLILPMCSLSRDPTRVSVSMSVQPLRSLGNRIPGPRHSKT